MESTKKKYIKLNFSFIQIYFINLRKICKYINLFILKMKRKVFIQDISKTSDQFCIIIMRHCYSLSMFSLIILLLSVGAGAFWPYSGGQLVDATTLVNAPAQSGDVAGQQQSSSFHDLTLVNNGCVYHNGMIIENGGQSRKATAEEEAKVKEYLTASHRYQEQFQQSMAEHMRLIFAPPFPFGQTAAAWQFPQFPQFPRVPMADTPCFCESCRNASTLSQQVQSMNSVMGQTGANSANTYNQYSVVDGRQQ